MTTSTQPPREWLGDRLVARLQTAHACRPATLGGVRRRSSSSIPATATARPISRADLGAPASSGFIDWPGFRPAEAARSTARDRRLGAQPRRRRGGFRRRAFHNHPRKSWPPPACGAPSGGQRVNGVDRLSAFCSQWMRAGSWQPDRLPDCSAADGRASRTTSCTGCCSSAAATRPANAGAAGLLLHGNICQRTASRDEPLHHGPGRRSAAARPDRLASALLHGGGRSPRARTCCGAASSATGGLRAHGARRAGFLDPPRPSCETDRPAVPSGTTSPDGHGSKR